MGTPPSPDSGFPFESMSPKARAYYEREFLPKYNHLLEEVLETPLVILVWGPGISGGLLYHKRIDILNELRRRGHAAEFSENIPGPVGMSPKMLEFAQAVGADLIISMAGSYGAIAEIHDFLEYRVIGSKMLIFVDEKATDGYSYQSAIETTVPYKNVETYKSPDDILQCHLLAKVVEKVIKMQSVKYRAQKALSWGLIA